VKMLWFLGDSVDSRHRVLNLQVLVDLFLGDSVDSRRHQPDMANFVTSQVFGG